MNLIVGLAGLVIASVTLVILIRQELRERRQRPRPDWAFGRVGSATITKDASSEEWETFEVTNSGTAAATITEARIFRAPQRFEDGYVIPKVLPADASARVLLGPGFEEAWIRITFHHQWWPGATVIWRPLVGASDLADELTDQILERRRRRWRPWRPSRNPRYVGPGGQPFARISPNHRRMQQRIVTALGHPEAELE